jgi:predicted nucleic acid-binding protein
LDSSFLVRLTLPHALSERAERLWTSWIDEDRRLIAPTLVGYELTNALFQCERAGVLAPGEAEAGLGFLLLQGVERRETAGLHERALAIARRHGLAATYDAHYLALAEAEGAELWTADAKLARAVRPALSWVRLLGEDGAEGGGGGASS